MTPDDPRHGKRRGYVAGCREDCCRNPHLHYQKRSTLRRYREGSQIVSAADVITRIDWWGRRGVGRSAIGKAARLGEGTLAEIMTGERDVCLRSTRAAVLAVSWDDLPANSLCNADITRHRIQSLMAAGHPLSWICERTPGLSAGGRWRRQACVTVGLARAVDRTYRAAPLDGPSRITLVKARNRGIPHPLGWDDPGDLAMPHNWTPPACEPYKPTSRADTVRELIERGAGISEACRVLHCTRDALEKWFARHDKLNELHILVGREQGMNRWNEGAA